MACSAPSMLAANSNFLSKPSAPSMASPLFQTVAFPKSFNGLSAGLHHRSLRFAATPKSFSSSRRSFFNACFRSLGILHRISRRKRCLINSSFKRRYEIYAVEQEMLLEAANFIKQNGAKLGSTQYDFNSQ